VPDLSSEPREEADRQASAIRRGSEKVADLLNADTLSVLRELAADEDGWQAAASDPRGVLTGRGIEIPDDTDIVLIERAREEGPAAPVPAPAEDADTPMLRAFLQPDVYLANRPRCPPGWRPVWQLERRWGCTKAAKVTKCVGGRLPSGECAANQVTVVCLQEGWFDAGHWVCVPAT
jgi:hypothetical protein